MNDEITIKLSVDDITNEVYTDRELFVSSPEDVLADALELLKRDYLVKREERRDYMAKKFAS